MKKYTFSLILALTFFLIQFITLPDYGINWDAPYRWTRGQAYLNFFLTGRHNYPFQERNSPFLMKLGQRISRFDPSVVEVKDISNLPERPLLKKDHLELQKETGLKSSFYQSSNYNLDLLLKEDLGHPPLPDIIAAMFNKIFFQTLNILDDIGGYHIFYILVSSLGVFITCLFTFEILFSLKPLEKRFYLIVLSSLMAGLSIAFYPIFFAEAHFNMKDPLTATLFTISIWSFWHWVKENKLKYYWFFTASTAFSLGIKWNIAFMPIILIFWLVLIRKTPHFKVWFQIKKLFWLLIIFLIINSLFLILIWPYVWSDPFNKLIEVAKFYQDLGLRTDLQQPDGFVFFNLNFYPIFLVLTQTPTITLLLSMSGIIAIIARKVKFEYSIGSLLILWLFIPILRISLPHIWFYNGLRQIMEILPVIAIFSGIGFYYLTHKLKSSSSSSLIPIITLLILLYPIIKLHPNENFYFNFLIGGTKGVYEKKMVDQKTSFGNVYKQAANWLNEHAVMDSNIALVDGNMFALSPLFLREDMSISPNHFSGFDQKGEYILELYNPKNPNYFAYQYPYIFLKPVHQILVDGFPVLSIFKNDPKFNLFNFKEFEKTDLNTQIKNSSEGEFFSIDLGANLKITRIKAKNPSQGCKKIDYKFSDEKFQFSTFDKDSSFPLSSAVQKQSQETFIFNEKRILPEDIVEYVFPATSARVIKILPVNADSCFSGGDIVSISYLQP